MRIRLLLSLATVVGLLVFLMAACEVLWQFLFDPALCERLGSGGCSWLAEIGNIPSTVPLLVAVSITLMIGVVLIRRVTRPLYDLAAATRAISAGDYSVRVAATSTGEVGELATAMNELAEALQRSERRRHEIVSNVTHQLKTPLTSLDGYLAAIRDGIFEADGPTLERLIGQTSRLKRLVSDLRMLSEVERLERLPLELKAVELGSVLEELVDWERPRFAAKGLHLALRIPSAALLVAGDQHWLIQLFTNLLDNAHRYSAPGGSVRMCAEGGAESISVTVTDSGCGISAADLPHIFERFYRGGEHANDGGTGIGLAIVDHVTRAHGGEVRVWSDPGCGARFQVILPSLPDRTRMQGERAILKPA